MPKTLHTNSSILRIALIAAGLLIGLLTACGSEPRTSADAGSGFDGSGLDAGIATDAAIPADLGALTDLGVRLDAGRDAGVADAGSTVDAGAMSSLCPPAGPFGSAVGDVSPDITLLDCDGNPHSLHSLCERDVVWLFEFADWCPPCRAFAMTQANTVYDTNLAAHPGEFEGWMVISETSSFGRPTAATCAAVRDRYGVHMPVLIDPDGLLQTALGVAPNEIHVVLEQGARIRWIGHYAGDEVAAQIDAAFAP